MIMPDCSDFAAIGRAGSRVKAISVVVAALAWVGMTGRADAIVMVTDPNDGSPFATLFRPDPTQFDETALSGVEYQISSLTGVFRANDQYMISGQETDEATSIGNELGDVNDLSGTPFGFSLQHNLLGGRNFTFSVTNHNTMETDVLCWGQNCAPGSNSTEILNGIPPIFDYNGLAIQVRAQEVVGSSAAVTITSLTGVSVAGANFFDEVVTLTSPGTISLFDAGRRGQWMLADDNDLVLNEWELSGTVTLIRPDAALGDRTKVRLAIDLVREPSLAFIPEPSTQTLVLIGIPFLIGLDRLRALPVRPTTTQGWWNTFLLRMRSPDA
jgi:hypothetical protein